MNKARNNSDPISILASNISQWEKDFEEKKDIVNNYLHTFNLQNGYNLTCDFLLKTAAKIDYFSAQGKSFEEPEEFTDFSYFMQDGEESGDIFNNFLTLNFFINLAKKIIQREPADSIFKILKNRFYNENDTTGITQDELSKLFLISDVILVISPIMENEIINMLSAIVYDDGEVYPKELLKNNEAFDSKKEDLKSYWGENYFLHPYHTFSILFEKCSKCVFSGHTEKERTQFVNEIKNTDKSSEQITDEQVPQMAPNDKENAL